MKKHMIWLAAFLISLLLTVTAFAVPLPPQTADDAPLPAYSVPVVSNVIISGDTVTMDVSGTYDVGGVIINATTPSGEVEMYLNFTLTGSGLTGTVTGLPADTISWRLGSVRVYNLSTPDYSMYFYYDAAGALAYYSIQETAVTVIYSFDNQGQLTNYYADNMNASYNQDGRLDEYTVTTPTGEERYNGQNELLFERVTDAAAGTSTELSYNKGVLMSRIVTTADFSMYFYNGQGVLRRSIITGSDGMTINLYDANGNQYAYGEQNGSGYMLYDTEGNLVTQFHFDGGLAVTEMYRNGKLTTKTVTGQLPDGRNYTDVYENGVYTGRTIIEDDGDYHYDADGNYTGKTVYDGDAAQEFNAEGVLTQYDVYSQQQGGVWLTYNYRRVLQSVTYYDPYLYDMYRYDAKEKIWYLNEVPYDGPVPVILSELTLEKAIVWYPNNTVCSFGPQFRDLKPDLTDLWYMFTPVDLSHDGTQTFELVGGSVYVLGQVSVTVSGDSVTVNYSTIKGKRGNIYMKSEYLNFFPDLASVKTVNPEELGDGFKFGQAISIQKDLGGDTNVLMFVRNVATFCNFVDKDTLLRRFYKNLPDRAELRDQMLAMMD